MGKEKKVRPAFTPAKVLSQGWPVFSSTLPLLTEKEALLALNEENKDKKRPEYIFRLHRKYNQLRYAREQREYGVVSEKRRPYHRKQRHGREDGRPR